MKEDKLTKFTMDEVMFEAVFERIQSIFLKPRTEKDVHYLAAKSLSTEFLDEAKRDFVNRYRVVKEGQAEVKKQVGY